MLDFFLQAAYQNNKREEQISKLAQDMKKLPNGTLLKLASGTMKLSFHGDAEWLEKYKGTTLFEEAIALEKADLESEVARQSATQNRPDTQQFYDTQDQIRLQKKMLDLKLVELQEQMGMGLKPGGELQTEATPTAQGAGALGDVAPEGVQDAIGGTVGAKTGSVEANFQKAALDLKALGQGALAAATKNPSRLGALAGAGVGAVGGAVAGGPDHRLSGALGGAALGAGVGHAGAGIGSRMMGGKNLGQAASAYGTGVRRNMQATAMRMGVIPGEGSIQTSTAKRMGVAGSPMADIAALKAKSMAPNVPAATHGTIDLSAEGGVPQLVPPNPRDFAERGMFGQPKMAEARFKAAMAQLSS